MNHKNTTTNLCGNKNNNNRNYKNINNTYDNNSHAI